MELTRENFRAMIYYDFQRGLLRQECIDQLTSTFGDKAPSFATVKRWYNEFNRSCVNKECGLVYDEMSITSKRIFDTSLNATLGNITFPNDQNTVTHATHALVFMLVGTASRWKHIVDYHFTEDSFNSLVLKDIVLYFRLYKQLK
ncbi:hypothetical protein ALC60_14098 [Trachymyrmex zeteki]|uniref:Uncharacterized protein n=1 Tax=Mycetomoellerius zeteki TaxID=64791 RepID=A0A151WGA4_9HYME|nr:hypothetical protein ALC60_14098 [Trachymyrmex zeteki]